MALFLDGNNAMTFGICRRILFVLVALFTIAAAREPAGAQVSPAADPPVIAAASDLHFALTEAAETFAAETGLHVELAFGSSGNFVRQIRQGAPFQMFLSADEEFVRTL